MTKTELKQNTTELLDGFEMNDTLFGILLSAAQTYYENRRPWVWLRAEDTSANVSTSDTFETAKQLPTDFGRWYTRFPIVLTDSLNTPQRYLSEVPIDRKTAFKSNSGRFYCDYRNGTLYICGTASQQLTVRQYYLMRPERIANDNEWVFPEDYHQILPFTVAAFHKYGIDYDIVNAKQGDEHVRIAQMLYSSMEEWDETLALSALEGQDYYNDPPGSASSDGMSGYVY